MKIVLPLSQFVIFQFIPQSIQRNVKVRYYVTKVQIKLIHSNTEDSNNVKVLRNIFNSKPVSNSQSLFKTFRKSFNKSNINGK